jgi:transcription initiation factor TFIID subunit 1
LSLEDKSTDEDTSSDDDDADGGMSHAGDDLMAELNPQPLGGGAAARRGMPKSPRSSVSGYRGRQGFMGDDTSTVASGLQSTVLTAQVERRKKLKIKRAFKNTNGDVFWRTQVVVDPAVIAGYMKGHDRRMKSNRTQQLTAKFERNEARRLKQRLESLKTQKAEYDKQSQGSGGGRDSPSTVKKPNLNLKCGRCGRTGHIQTNRNCPMYYNGQEGVPDELRKTQAVEKDFSTENLIQMEGSTLKIKTKQIKSYKTAKEDQARAFRARTSVGRRAPKRAKHADETDSDLNLTSPWENKMAPQRASVNRAKNPEVTLCTALEDVVKELKHLDKARWFWKPVSGVEDYESIVESPIDLGTIHDKCTAFAYRSRHQFLDDVRLLARNALMYNGATGPNAAIYKVAGQIRDKAINLISRRSGEFDPAEQALGSFVETSSEAEAASEIDRDFTWLAEQKLRPDIMRLNEARAATLAAQASSVAPTEAAAAPPP